MEISYATSAEGSVKHVRDNRPPDERLNPRRNSLCGRADLVATDAPDSLDTCIHCRQVLYRIQEA